MKRIHVILGIILLGVVAIFGFFFLYKEDGLLKVYFLDIGQGDAIYIRSPDGHDMLIDGGPSAVVIRRLAEVMPWYDHRIDYVIETHPDADHIGGLPDVLRRFDVGEFLEPGIESKNAIDDEMRRIIKEKGIVTELARRGIDIDLGAEVSFHVLFPDEDVSRYKNTNDASVVGRVVYGSTSVMLNGDSPQNIENHLLELDAAGLRSNVLKAGHHGSRTSSGETYVKTVDPEYAVISAGKDNRYHHPHAEVIELFQKLGIKILRTDEQGTIEFVSDSKTIKPK